MAHIVHCRVCKKEIDIDSSHDWILPSTNWYYHPNCYQDWIARKGDRSILVNRNENDWYELLKDYLWRDLKMPGLDWQKVTSQWKNFINSKKYTPKGIYFAVIYFYEVQHGNVELAKGGIGIVSSIYHDSAEYWSNLEQKRKGTLDDIVKQMAARLQRPILTVQDTHRRNTSRIKYNLNDIGETDNDG